LFRNAAANNYKKVMFYNDAAGNRVYTNLSGEMINDENAPLGSNS